MLSPHEAPLFSRSVGCRLECWELRFIPFQLQDNMWIYWFQCVQLMGKCYPRTLSKLPFLLEELKLKDVTTFIRGVLYFPFNLNELWFIKLHVLMF